METRHKEACMEQQSALCQAEQARKEAALSSQKYAAELKEVERLLDNARANLQSVSDERDRLQGETARQREELEEMDLVFARKQSKESSSGARGGDSWFWAAVFGNSSEKKSRKQRTEALVEKIDRQEDTLRRAEAVLQEKEAQLKRRDEQLVASREQESKLRAQVDAAREEVGCLTSVLASRDEAVVQAEEDRKQLLQQIDKALQRERRAQSKVAAVETEPCVAACLAEATESLLDLQRASNETKFKVKYRRDAAEEYRYISVSRESHDMFAELLRLTRERLGLATDELFFKYKDGAGDEITVDRSSELTEATCQFPSSCPKLILCTRKRASSKAVATNDAPVGEAGYGGGAEEALLNVGGAKEGALDEPCRCGCHARDSAPLTASPSPGAEQTHAQ